MSSKGVFVEALYTFDPTAFEEHGWTVQDYFTEALSAHTTVARTIQYDGSDFCLVLQLIYKGSIFSDCRRDKRFALSISTDSITVSDKEAVSPITFWRSDAKHDILLEAMMWCLKQKYPEPVGGKTKAAGRT